MGLANFHVVKVIIHKIKYVKSVCLYAKHVLMTTVVIIVMMVDTYMVESVNLVKVNVKHVRGKANV